LHVESCNLGVSNQGKFLEGEFQSFRGNWDIKLINILGHTGLEGNDIVDNLVKDVAHQILRGEISAPNDISKPAAFEVARDISRKSWQRFWDYDRTARCTKM